MAKGNSNRRFFAAKAEAADAFISIAERKGLTLYSLLSDVLRKIVDLDADGGSLDDAIAGFRLFKTSKEIGFLPVPESLWYDMVELSFKTDRKGTIARFADAGEWLGKYVLSKSRENDPAKYLTSCLAPLTCDASEFSIDGVEAMNLRCVNPRHTQPYTELFSTLLTKAIETLGYECESRTVSKGMILLSFHKAPKIEQKTRGEIIA